MPHDHTCYGFDTGKDPCSENSLTAWRASDGKAATLTTDLQPRLQQRCSREGPQPRPYQLLQPYFMFHRGVSGVVGEKIDEYGLE